MTWGKHLGITIVIALIVIALHFVYGEVFLVDIVSPAGNGEIGEWIDSYESAGIVASILGVIISAIWFYIGESYNGRSNVVIRYVGLVVLSLISGGGTIYMLDESSYGAGLAKIFLPLSTLVIFYLSSFFASSDAVKNVPPGR